MGNQESFLTIVSGKFDQLTPTSKIAFKAIWEKDYIKQVLMLYPGLNTKNEGEELSYCIYFECEIPDNSLLQKAKTALDELKENDKELYELFHIVKSEILNNKLIATIIFQKELGNLLKKSNDYFSKKFLDIFNKKMYINLQLETNLPIKKILNKKLDPLSQISEGFKLEVKGSKDINWLKTIINQIAKNDLKDQDFANAFGPFFDFLDRLDYIYGKVELSDNIPFLKELKGEKINKELEKLFELVTEIITKMKIKSACKELNKIKIIFPLHPILVLESEIEIPKLFETITSYSDSN